MANIYSVNCLTGEETVAVSDRVPMAPEAYYKDGHIEPDTNVRIEEKETLKASAKAKLIAGEALTEAEAATIVI